VHTRFQRTPLYAATEERHTEIVKLLLDEKADMNARAGNDGDTLLYNAAVGGQVEIVKLLLENKADVNKQNTDGDTPLKCARLCKLRDIIKPLE